MLKGQDVTGVTCKKKHGTNRQIEQDLSYLKNRHVVSK